MTVAQMRLRDLVLHTYWVARERSHVASRRRYVTVVLAFAMAEAQSVVACSLVSSRVVKHFLKQLRKREHLFANHEPPHYCQQKALKSKPKTTTETKEDKQEEQLYRVRSGGEQLYAM
ncbi:hypothetical protein LR48_Vigan05g116200 [Vigna angularis]|uniref:Uncharacterized protein n=1 Tax=Phaseolus angularis TaxID=3914 RepID=A0A0L9ULY4_PHAAN|nr:hypothetical protein LR48_Vigan05g116200 [Vigna angularis]